MTHEHLTPWSYFGRADLGRERRHIWHRKSDSGELIWNVAPNGAGAETPLSPATGGYVDLAWLLRVKGCVISSEQWRAVNNMRAEFKKAPLVDWVKCDETEYFEMLGALPPEDRRAGGFLVGEPTDHIRGYPVFQAYFKDEKGGYWKSGSALSVANFRNAIDRLTGLYVPALEV